MDKTLILSDMKEFLKQLPGLTKDKHAENKKYFVKLKKKPPKNLDYVMQELHDADIKQKDCLECANCCKATGRFLRRPIFSEFPNI